MNILIKRIDQKEHLFTTIGDWRFDEKGDLIILVSKMSDWRYEATVIVHELIEYFICKNLNVTLEQCDAFDSLFEQEYKLGIQPLTAEPGFDKRCPFHKGHLFGSFMERIMITILGASWKSYVEECYQLMGITEKVKYPILNFIQFWK